MNLVSVQQECMRYLHPYSKTAQVVVMIHRTNQVHSTRKITFNNISSGNLKHLFSVKKYLFQKY